MNANGREWIAWGTARVVIGIFYDVYNELGPGFLESVYRDAMAVAIRGAGLLVKREVDVDVAFRGVRVGTFRADLIVGDELLVELKAARNIDDAHIAQVLNYLRATRLEVGLLLNFGRRPAFRRVVYANDRKRRPADSR
jgi:GxxExxY protein